MSLEALNTVGTLITVAIVAATAIAALIQLRHLRAGNQISAMTAIDAEIMAEKFREAVVLIRERLRPAMSDPAYRAYEIACSRDQQILDVNPAYVALRQATLLVGNAYEHVGLLLKLGMIDHDMFLDRYCSNVFNSWNRLEPLTALAREAYGSQLPWENFEYLAVLSEDWMKAHVDGSYPHGVRRMKLTNPWPIAPQAAAT